MKSVRFDFRAWLMAATCLTAVTAAANAQTTTAPAPAAATTTAPAADAPPPGYWFNGIHLWGQIEAGADFNPAGPKLNNGQLFTDHPNTALLNQLYFGAEKKIDPKATGWDWAFKLAGMYGSDARYIHTLGTTEQALPRDQRDQIDLVEASATLHIPMLGEGGMDAKVGYFVTPLGYEFIDPSLNAFYTHSYIFNFGLPFKHVGFLTTTHVTGLLDLYFGVDTGTNTSFGANGENNSAPGGILGLGLNMMDGNLTFVALTHLGPENPTRVLAPLKINADGYMRYYNDANITWKVDDKLTVAGEVDYVYDQLGGIITKGKPAAANAFGVAGYVSYALTDQLALNGRVEIFRDDNGFFVASFPGNYDSAFAQKGLPNTSYGSPPATYGALTVGVTYKPTVPGWVTGLMIRPEARVDQSLGGNNVFNAYTTKAGTIKFKDSTAITLGSDVVLTF